MLIVQYGLHGHHKEAKAASTAPWWWYEVGSEVCSSCHQAYAYQTGYYCFECDSNVCSVCVQETEVHEVVCTSCCSE